jgi:hypothetical protein
MCSADIYDKLSNPDACTNEVCMDLIMEQDLHRQNPSTSDDLDFASKLIRSPIEPLSILITSV